VDERTRERRLYQGRVAHGLQGGGSHKAPLRLAHDEGGTGVRCCWRAADEGRGRDEGTSGQGRVVGEHHQGRVGGGGGRQRVGGEADEEGVVDKEEASHPLLPSLETKFTIDPRHSPGTVDDRVV
jgi:hypothetical protein